MQQARGKHQGGRGQRIPRRRCDGLQSNFLRTSAATIRAAARSVKTFLKKLRNPRSTRDRAVHDSRRPPSDSPSADAADSEMNRARRPFTCIVTASRARQHAPDARPPDCTRAPGFVAATRPTVAASLRDARQCIRRTHNAAVRVGRHAGRTAFQTSISRRHQRRKSSERIRRCPSWPTRYRQAVNMRDHA